METRTAWEQTRQIELKRVDTLDRQIHLAERLDRSVAHRLMRERDVGLSIEP